MYILTIDYLKKHRVEPRICILSLKLLRDLSFSPGLRDLDFQPLYMRNIIIQNYLSYFNLILINIICKCTDYNFIVSRKNSFWFSFLPIVPDRWLAL